MAPLDFSPLDGPLVAGEGRARRRALRNGRAAVAEFSLVQWLGLVFVGFAWLVLVPTVVVLLGVTLEWFLERGPTPDYQLGAPLFVGGSAIALIGLAILTRLLVLPPRWGRWVRMQRFAEANDLVFVRRATRDDLPAGVANAEAGVGLLTDAFLDPATGIVAGNAGEGIGRQGFVLVPDGAPDDDLAPGEAPLRGFDLVATRDGRLGLRHRSVGRSSAGIRALFATVDAVRRGDRTAIR
jgi:hypothetical protein